jgi:hypothetical protein
VDVLIADIDMPGMKGTDLAQQATERWPNLRVLLVSGGAADARGFTVLQNPSIRKVKERDGGNDWAVLKTRRNPRSTMSEHRYKIGQLVDYLGRVRATGVYQITQLLPSEEDTFRYRIKNPNEPHERVVLEILHSAHPVELPAEWARGLAHLP